LFWGLPCKPRPPVRFSRPFGGAAARGRHCVPVPAFVLLSPVLRRGGGGRRLTLHLRWIILVPTPTPALSVFLRFRRRCGSPSREPSKPSFGHDPSFPLVRKCLGGLRIGRVFRVVSFLTMRLPALRSAAPSTHCPASGSGLLLMSCFVKVLNPKLSSYGITKLMPGDSR